jgi:RES domain-containing protein
VSVELVTFRLANFETPLWATPNLSDGRYNRAADPGTATQYMSLHPMTPWAELLRNEDRRSRDRALLMRYPLWAIRVKLDTEPRELTFDNASDYGLEPEDLVSDVQGPCQGLADQFRRGGEGVFVAPSAAVPGTRNLVVLGERVMIGFEHVPLEDVDLPVAMAAQGARCPEGLWAFTHYRSTGTPHPAFEAWQLGENYVFTEPEISSASLVV